MYIIDISKPDRENLLHMELIVIVNEIKIIFYSHTDFGIDDFFDIVYVLVFQTREYILAICFPSIDVRDVWY